MEAFQYKFFRGVYDAKELGGFHVNPNPVKAAYCSYNNQVLQLVVSSLYISALFSGIIASKFARLYGRKASPPSCFVCCFIKACLYATFCKFLFGFLQYAVSLVMFSCMIILRLVKTL